MNDLAPGELLGPDDPSLRVGLDPATALEGDTPLVIRSDDPWAAGLRRIDAHHALVRQPGDATSHAVLGPVSVGRDGRAHREVVVDGWRFAVSVVPERLARLRERASSGREEGALGGRIELRAVIPGRLVAVSVAVGDHVEAGQQVLVIEAMKMQNEVRAPHAGVVERIDVAPGQTLELGALLLVIA